MSDDPRALEPCRLWLAVGGALATANKQRIPPDLSTTPVDVVARHPIARVIQTLSGSNGTQLRFTLVVVTTKPSRFEVRYRDQALAAEKGPSTRWPEMDGVHASAEVMGKTLTFAVYINERAAAVQRLLVESPFMRHAQAFGIESKLSRLEYGWTIDGMTSTIEGSWRGSEEDHDDRCRRLGFVPYNDKTERELTPEEWEALLERRIPAGIELRDLENDGRMEMRGAVTLEVRYGVAARPTVRTR